MTFLVIMLNVLALSAFTVLWLSISFIAIEIYKTKSNVDSAMSLARISNVLRLIVLVWFILLGIAFTTADNLLPLVLYVVLFVGIYGYIYRLYGNILKTVSSIRKDGDSDKSRALIINSITKYERSKTNLTKQKDFAKFRKFFWGLNLLICLGTLVNFWIMDTGESPFWEVVAGSVIMVLMLQILFVPIYLIVRKIVYSTLVKQ